VSIRCSINGAYNQCRIRCTTLSPNRRSSEAPASLCWAVNSSGSFEIRSETASLSPLQVLEPAASDSTDFGDGSQTSFFAHELLDFANVQQTHSLLAFIGTGNECSTDVQSWLQTLAFNCRVANYVAWLRNDHSYWYITLHSRRDNHICISVHSTTHDRSSFI